VIRALRARDALELSLEDEMTLVNLSRRAPAHLPDGAYDVRGWEVRTEMDDEKVGKVDDMLVDENDHPRYLEVNLGVFRRHVLVPLSEAHADPSTQVVWIEQLDKERLGELPEYGRDSSLLSPEYEDRLHHEYRTLRSRRFRADGDIDERVDEEMPRLARLGDVGDFRVAKGVTDPRGWKVLSGDGVVVGEVKELIVDPAALTTRYLDVDVKEDALDLEPVNRHVLVPSDRVRLDRKEKHVVIDGIFARDIGDYPQYTGLPLAPDAERSIDEAYGRPRDGRGREAAATRFFGVRRRAMDARPAPARSRGRPITDEARDIEPVTSDIERVDADTYEIPRDGENVRIRISGDDIIIERQPRGGRDDG
jgi:hypothetical protein